MANHKEKESIFGTIKVLMRVEIKIDPYFLLGSFYNGLRHGNGY